MRSGLVLGLSLFAACEHIDDVGDVGSPVMPPATDEPQRLNLDEVGPRIVHARDEFGPLPPAVSRVMTPLADPRYPAPPRAQTVAFEDPPPPVPVGQLQEWFALLASTDRKAVREVCREIRAEPCSGLIGAMADGQLSRFDQLIAQLGPDGSTAVAYCNERDGLRRCMTPLVVAFDDAAIELERSAGSFAFDPGMPVTTDWPSARTPWVALDRDGDGAITSGAELFGDATVLPGGEKASNGFAALAALDANGDRVIDHRDPMFAKLVLWADRDGDRRSTAIELRPLMGAIDAIPLDHEVVPRCADGNCEGERGAMIWRDAEGHRRTGAVIDLYLQRR